MRFSQQINEVLPSKGEHFSHVISNAYNMSKKNVHRRKVEILLQAWAIFVKGALVKCSALLLWAGEVCVFSKQLETLLQCSALLDTYCRLKNMLHTTCNHHEVSNPCSRYAIQYMYYDYGINCLQLYLNIFKYRNTTHFSSVKNLKKHSKIYKIALQE